MSKVTFDTMTPEHVKAARAFLRWSATDLAGHAKLNPVSVRRFESGSRAGSETRQAIFDALTDAGIVFQNGGNPGARLMSGKA